MRDDGLEPAPVRDDVAGGGPGPTSPGADLDHGAADEELSLREAAQLYDVSRRTLEKQVRWRQVDAYKARGPWGPQWRVSRQALEAAGYRRRPPVQSQGQVQEERIAAMARELAALRRVAAAERNRADRADQELGYAMLECGRLRAALARARRDAAGDDPGRPLQPAVVAKPGGSVGGTHR